MAILEELRIIREEVAKIVSYKLDGTVIVGNGFRTTVTASVTAHPTDDEELQAAIGQIENLMGQRAIQTMERALTEDKE
jgi:hypothetical protein